MKHFPIRRLGAVAALAGLSLLLTGCLLSPGKFTSALDVRKDGRFTFSYTGEMHLLPLSELARKGDKGADAPFEPSTCYDSEKGEDRDCTKEEIAEQKKTWEEDRKAAAERKKKDADMAKAMLGVDPEDPKAAEELAGRLRKQAGWKSVVYKGNGLFEVDFAISGVATHDFAFPTIERFPAANPFVALVKRADGSLRIDAPGFVLIGGDPMRTMLKLGAMSESGESKDKAGIPTIDGTFTITTDAAVLANNTDDGPQPVANGQKMSWKIENSTLAAPMALLRLGN